MSNYFSDREGTPRVRNIEQITPSVWGGIVGMIQQRIDDGSLGYAYPEMCADFDRVVCGCNSQKLMLAIHAEIPTFPEFLSVAEIPSTFDILDLLEFLYRAIAKPEETDFHSYFHHAHLKFDSDAGKLEFRQFIDRLFSRNGVAFELNSDGLIIRLVPEVLRERLTQTLFKTGDQELDRLLNVARERFLKPNPDDRRESLEKLWDAWERLKTIEAVDKKSSITSLLEKASPEVNFRTRLDAEAKELTAIGNQFRIRHSETSQIHLEVSEHIDYLFQRLFALIYLLLTRTNRINVS